MAFEEFLRSNNLPCVGERVITPAGDRVEIERYVFDRYDDYVNVRFIDKTDWVVEWTLDQLKLCRREEE